MLFTAPEFLFGLLPITVVGYFLFARFSHRIALGWLSIVSLFFYGWWKAEFVPLLLLSTLVNYAVGRRMMDRPSAVWLAGGVAFNLGLLGFFKYANFVLRTVNAVSEGQLPLLDIALPLAISFFTFQQIAFLVDVHQGVTKDRSFLHYLLFVVFFPQLIAGPIVHHAETIPQFASAEAMRPRLDNFTVGLSIFIFGFYKKAVLADGIAYFSDPVFNSAAAGTTPHLIAAWGGCLAYTLQLYFDFSGYSDMAIGLSRIFGVRLPINFNAPYKAVDIIDFWRRWHITLSRFLMRYLYVPLGGNRVGPYRQVFNVAITMLLGGLWHGAAWTFVIWGGLHGLMLGINHAWRRWRASRPDGSDTPSVGGRFAGRVLTFLTVAAAWVIFRAADWDTAMRIYAGMVGMGQTVLPESWLPLASWIPGVEFGRVTLFDGNGAAWIVTLLAVVWFAPTTQQWLSPWRPALDAPAEPVSASDDRVYWLAPFLISAIPIMALIVLGRGADSRDFIYMIF